MLLAIDCGNTNTEFGLYRDNKLIADHRFTTNDLGTSSECALSVDWMLSRQELKRGDIKAVVIGSVVPHVTGQLIEMAEKYYDINPVVVSGQSGWESKSCTIIPRRSVPTGWWGHWRPTGFTADPVSWLISEQLLLRCYHRNR